MSEDNEKVEPQAPPKRRGTFWYVVIAGIVLLIVYQSGRSSGVRSTLVYDGSQSENVTVPIPSEPVAERPSSNASSPRPTVRRSESSPEGVRTVPLDHPAVQEYLAKQASDRAQRAAERPSSVPVVASAAPARVIETGPPSGLIPEVIGPVDLAAAPLPAPLFSVYDRVPSSGGSARASELGAMPLTPLQPLAIPTLAPSVAPVPVLRPVSSSAPLPAPSSVRRSCDCGVVH